MKRFEANTALYYLMLISFFLMECYDVDVAEGMVPAGSYARRLRRTLVDVAGKIVRSSRQVTLRVCESVWNGLDFQHLCQRGTAAGFYPGLPPVAGPTAYSTDQHLLSGRKGLSMSC